MKRLSTLFCSQRATPSLILLLIGLLVGATPLQAKISIVADNDHSFMRHYYADGVYYHFVEGILMSSYDPSNDRCMRINHEQRQYITGSCRKMNQILIDHLSTHYKLYQEDKTIPAEQRQFMELFIEMNREQAAIPLKAVSVGKNKHLGYPVEVYEIRYQDKPIKEIWISSVLRKELLQVFDLDAFQKEQREGHAKQVEAFPLTANDPLQRIIEELEQKGVVLKSLPSKNFSYKELDPNLQLIVESISNHYEATKIEKKATPNPDFLKPPPFYKEAESMELFITQPSEGTFYQ